MSVKRTKSLRNILRFTVFSLILAASGLIFVYSGLYHRVFSSVLRNLLSRQGLELRMEVQEADLRSRLRVADLELRGVSGSFQFEADSLELSYESVFHLLRRNFDLLRVYGADLQLKGGGSDETDMLRREKATAALRIGRVQLRDASVSLAVSDSLYRFSPVEFSSSLNLQGDTVSVGIRSLSLPIEDESTRFEGRLLKIRDLMRIEAMTVRRGESELHLNGKVMLSRPWHYRIETVFEPLLAEDLPLEVLALEDFLRRPELEHLKIEAEIEAEGRSGRHFVQAGAELSAGGRELRLRQGRFQLEGGELRILEADIEESEQVLGLSGRLITDGDSLTGELDFHYSFGAGGDYALSAEGRAAGSGQRSGGGVLALSSEILSAQVPGIAVMEAQLRYDQGQWHLDPPMNLQHPAGQLILGGSLDSSGVEMTLAADFPNPGILGVETLSSRQLGLDGLAFNSRVSGDPRDPHIEGDLLLQGLRLFKDTQGAEQIRGFFRIDKVFSERNGDIYLNIKKGRIAHLREMDGLLLLENRRDTLMLNSLQLSNGNDRVESRAALYPDLSFLLEGLAFRINEQTLLLDSSLIISLNPAAADTHSFELRFNDRPMQLELARTDGANLQFRAAVDSLVLSDLGEFFDLDSLPLTGMAEGVAEAGFREGKFLSSFDMRARAGKILGQPFDLLDLSAVTDSALKVQRFSLQIPGGRSLEGSAMIPLHFSFAGVLPSIAVNSPAQVTLVADRFRLDPLGSVLPTLLKPRGEINSVLSLSGTLNDPVLQSTVSISELNMARMDVSKAYAKLQYRSEQLRISELRAYTAGGEYSLEGTLPLRISIPEASLNFRRDLPMDISITGTDTTLPYLTAFIPVIEELNGRFDTRLHIGGSMNHPVRNGELQVRDGDVTIAYMADPATELQGSGLLQNNILQLDIQGRMAGRQKSTQIGAAIDQLLRNESEQKVRLLGTLDMNSFFRPVLDLRIRGRQLYFRDLVENIRIVTDAELRIQGQRAVSITGLLNITEGEFQFEFSSREAGLKNLRPSSLSYEIRIPVRQDTYIRNSLVDAELQGEIILTKQAGQPDRIGGELNLLNGKFYYYSSVFDITQGTIIFDQTRGNHSIDFTASTPIGDGSNRIAAHLSGELNKTEIRLWDEQGKYLSQSQLIQILTTGIIPESAGASADVFSGTAQNIVGAVLEKEMERTATDLGGFSRVDFRSNSSGLSPTELDSMSILLGRRLGKNVYMTYERNLSATDPKQEIEVEYRINRNVSVIGAADEESVSAAFRLRFQF